MSLDPDPSSFLDEEDINRLAPTNENAEYGQQTVEILAEFLTPAVERIAQALDVDPRAVHLHVSISVGGSAYSVATTAPGDKTMAATDLALAARQMTRLAVHDAVAEHLERLTTPPSDSNN